VHQIAPLPCPLRGLATPWTVHSRALTTSVAWPDHANWPHIIGQGAAPATHAISLHIPSRHPFFKPVHGPFFADSELANWLQFVVCLRTPAHSSFNLVFSVSRPFNIEAVEHSNNMDFFTTKAPPSTPVDTDAVAQMESDRQVMCSTFIRLKTHTNIRHRSQKHFRVNPESYVPTSAMGHGPLFASSPIKSYRRVSTYIASFRTRAS